MYGSSKSVGSFTVTKDTSKDKRTNDEFKRAPNIEYIEEISNAYVAIEAKNYGDLDDQGEELGEPPLLLQYLGMLLSIGKFNVFELLKLTQLDLNQNKKHLLKECWVEDKLECSEKLGDLVKTMDDDLALQTYVKIRAILKLIALLVDHKEFEFDNIFKKLIPQVEYSPSDLFLRETVLFSDPWG
ncbi:hypothetical protein V6N12_025449 [Hibiscus sabdariffa]|uniref:Uncharacterized protein n=1 Tax=Hibiscus sabdariffa TaxID=183260 RepID=A0ABR2CIH6_9ROSI